MSAEYTGALWIPSPHFGYGQGATGQNTCKYIIVHGTAGFTRAEDVGYFFQNNNPATSVHFVVGQDGKVVQCVHEKDAAWGNGVVTNGHAPFWNPNRNPNLDTISIEHVKPDEHNATLITPAQKKASFQLIAYLCKKHSIPGRDADANGGITTHASIDPVNRSGCPGPYPWDELWSFLQGNTNMTTVPAGWHDDGKTLTAPNGHALQHGMRDMVLAGWDAANVPLTNEIYVTPCDPTDPKSGEGSRVYFRDCIAVWQKSTGHIYHVQHIGAYAKQLEDRAATAPAAVDTATLKKNLLQLATAEQASNKAIVDFINGI